MLRLPFIGDECANQIKIASSLKSCLELNDVTWRIIRADKHVVIRAGSL